MNNELIERLAREAGFTLSRTPDGRTLAHGSDNDLYPGSMPVGTNRELRRFAALLAGECARVADAVPPHTWIDGSDQFGQPCPVKVVARPRDAAKAIRAMFQEPSA